MARYHINGEGKASPCSATQRCPFGDASHHYESAEAARQAFEAEMLEKLFPPPPKKQAEARRKSQKELAAVAASATTAEEFAEVLAQGSEATRRLLAKNPSTPPAVLVEAREATQREASARAFLHHPSFPVGAMSGEEFLAVTQKLPWGERGRLFSSDEVRDEHVAAVVAAPPPTVNYYPALENRRNQLSEDFIVELSGRNRMVLERALIHGRYPLETRLGEVDLLMAGAAIRSITEPAHLELLASKALQEGHEVTLTRLAANRHCPPSTLEAIVAHSEDTHTLMVAYRHPQCSAAARGVAFKKNSTVRSYARLKELEEDGELASIGGEERPGRTPKERRVFFAVEAVKRLGLDEQAIDTYVRYFQGNYLFGPRYNPRTGVYSGYID